MRIILIYGTVEGQTKKISEYMAERFKAKGHDVDIVEAAAETAEVPDLSSAQAVVVAASVHQKTHNEAVVDFVLAHKAALSERPGAFVSVSLAVALPEDGIKEAEGYINDFISETGWVPTATLPVAGALKYDEYDFFKQQIVKFLVMQKGINVAPGEDHEFTDWAALDKFTDAFLATAQAG